jgi:hypothetical protein
VQREFESACGLGKREGDFFKESKVFSVVLEIFFVSAAEK